MLVNLKIELWHIVKFITTVGYYIHSNLTADINDRANMVHIGLIPVFCII